jgi:hypothetical protein
MLAIRLLFSEIGQIGAAQTPEPGNAGRREPNGLGHKEASPELARRFPSL